MSKVLRFKQTSLRVYWARRIMHYFVGHIPVYARTTTPPPGHNERVYMCYWCNAELKSGMWSFLYDNDGKANQ